jgi:chaperonin GroEL
MTGATLVDNEHVLKLEDIELKHFGRCKFIKMNEYETSIVDGQGDPERIQERFEEIKVTIEGEKKDRLKGVHKERLARL